MDILLLIKDQFIFFVSILVLLFLPGYTLLTFIPALRNTTSYLEKFILSFGLSIILLNFIMILMGWLSIPFTFISILSIPVIFLLLLLIFRKKQTTDTSQKKLFSFQKNSLILILLLLFLTIFIKTIYLSDTILPTSTDLGHHMYWSELIVHTQELPVYEKTKIESTDSQHLLTEPKPIADFIIGEHLIFSAISILSGVSLISAIPTLLLFLINIMGILAIFILSLRLFEGVFSNTLTQKIAISTLLFAGPLYAIASPQAKFVSGGVIGNLLGNILIPLVLYCYFRALKEKNAWMLFLAIFLTAGLFYTHHLSAFIFLFTFAFSIVFFILINFKNLFSHIKDWFKLIITPQNLLLLIGFALFLFYIFMPSYLATDATSTAVGGPSKSTRAGLSLLQLMYSAGELRTAFAFVGIIIVSWLGLRKRSPYAQAILLGWAISIFLMSFKPGWLHLDLPSGRIANYFSFPLMILAGLAFTLTFHALKKLSTILPKYFQVLSVWIFLLTVTSVFFSGFYDNASFIKKETNAQEAIQTFHASEYLSNHAQSDENIIKDHNYLTADVWMKVFFNNGYSYPFSRSYFKRYEDPTKPREQCTRLMISAPSSQEGQNCFTDLNTRYVVVNRSIDSSQFLKLENFWSIYQSNDVAVFYRHY